jgi:hypothetical protein
MTHEWDFGRRDHELSGMTPASGRDKSCRGVKGEPIIGGSGAGEIYANYSALSRQIFYKPSAALMCLIVGTDITEEI